MPSSKSARAARPPSATWCTPPTTPLAAVSASPVCAATQSPSSSSSSLASPYLGSNLSSSLWSTTCCHKSHPTNNHLLTICISSCLETLQAGYRHFCPRLRLTLIALQTPQRAVCGFWLCSLDHFIQSFTS
uniref:Uncharacterized protein n=1 Tax=Arundo donax TaxID=35708 RepID=A0A0A8YHC9_ARUDO